MLGVLDPAVGEFGGAAEAGDKVGRGGLAGAKRMRAGRRQRRRRRGRRRFGGGDRGGGLRRRRGRGRRLVRRRVGIDIDRRELVRRDMPDLLRLSRAERETQPKDGRGSPAL